MPSFPTPIGLGELDWEDDRFVIRRFLADSHLRASLARVDMLHPPWLWAKENRGYVVVDGFKRLRWAREKGIEAIPCRVFPAESSYEQLWLLRVEGKLFGPPLNAAEKAQLIAKAAATQPLQFLLDRLLPVLGLPSRLEVVNQWRRLSEAGGELLGAVAAEEVCERAALDLVNWGKAERGVLLALFRGLRCSASIQMEILERIAEIALLRDRPVLAVLDEPELQAIFNDQRVNHRRQTQLLRELLTRWRFPRLHAREERFARDVKGLLLPRRVRLLAPPAFEGEDWRLEITFSSPDELRNLLEETRLAAPSQVLAALMGPGAGGGRPDGSARSGTPDPAMRGK